MKRWSYEISYDPKTSLDGVRFTIWDGPHDVFHIVSSGVFRGIDQGTVNGVARMICENHNKDVPPDSVWDTAPKVQMPQDGKIAIMGHDGKWLIVECPPSHTLGWRPT